MSHETFLGSIFRHGLRSKYIKGFIERLGIGKYVTNMLNSVTGAGLTDAQKEANQFTADQAQKQMDFEERMSNTSFQRQVTDMKNAGVNPALAFGGTSNGASTPSGASGSSVSPTADPVGLLGQIQQLALLRSQKRNIDANTDKTIAETGLTKQNIQNAVANYQKIKAEVRKLGLDSDAQEIVNKYLDQKENTGLQNMILTGNNLAAQWTETQQKIANLKEEQFAIVQSVVESQQRVDNMLSQKALTEEQKKEVTELINQIKANTSKLIKESELTQKDIDFYAWNHGEAHVLPTGARTGIRTFNRVDAPKSKRK